MPRESRPSRLARVPRGVEHLPNGIPILCESPAELGHFYDDIFVKKVYVRHGISLPEGAVIFDVGANIGLFSLFVQETGSACRVLAFEPAPPLFEILTRNVARYGGAVECINAGLSHNPGEASLTYYPRSTGLSSFYADPDDEREALRFVVGNEAREQGSQVGRLMDHLEDYLDVRLEAVPFQCRLTTVSEVLEERRIARIDLLKVDVQKSEEDVLRGIREEHWTRVHQVVLEVHDVGDRLVRLKALLEDRGFLVHSEQDEHYEGSVLHNLYARRVS